MARERTVQSAGNVTLEYLRAQGVDLSPEAVKVPDIHTLVEQLHNPFEWLDRNGQPVPPETGLELYLVDESVGSEAAGKIIAAKVSEGFKKLPPGHGFRLRGVPSEGKLVMFRTEEVRRAKEEAERLARRRRVGRSSQTAVPGLGVITETYRDPT